MVSNRDTFHPYGAILKLPDGDIILAAGNNITITPAGGVLTIAAQVSQEILSFLSGYVPYTGATANVDLNNKNLTNVNNLGLNGDIDFSGIGEIKATYLLYTLSSTTFHGSGKNNIVFTGTYTGTSTPTYTLTITFLNAQVFDVDDTSQLFAGDSITGDVSGVGTILSVDPNGRYITVNASSSFVGDSSITDSTSGGSANITSGVTISDAGTLTDGTTTYLYFPLRRSSSIVINGITFSVTTISGTRYIGHTLTEYWTASISFSETLSDIFYGDLSTGTFVVGDKGNVTYGNVLSLDVNSSETRWQMKDKNDVWMSMGGDSQGHRPTFKGLGGSGSNRFVGVDNNGLTSNVANPLSLGAPVGSGVNDAVAYTNASGNLDSNSSFTYHNQSGASTFNLAFPSSSYGSWMHVDDNDATITIGNATSGFIEATGAGGGQFTMNGAQVNIQSLVGNQVLTCSPDLAVLQVGDIPSLGFGGVINFHGQAGLVDFGTITGTTYARFDMLNGVYTIGNTLGAAPFANVVQVDQSTGFTSLTNLPTYVNDAAAMGAGLTSGNLYKTTTAGSTFLKIVP